jgi:hypothetical protein
MANLHQIDSAAAAGAASGEQPAAAAVQAQLRRLLSHALFTNSKRYPVLLAYIVEQTLAGRASELKERTIGVEAFGRQPDYDVSVDPVVRMTAAEVRKRLSQYYYRPEHAAELVVDLAPGSYVPIFHEPVQAPHRSLPESASASAKTHSANPSAGTAVALGAFRPLWKLALVLVLALAAGFLLGRIKYPWEKSDLERFWLPITSAGGRITYCLGEPTEALDRASRATDELQSYGSLNVSDVLTLARSIEPLMARNGQLRVLAASKTGFDDLRLGPDVMIGAFDNPWSLRILRDLPLAFELRGSDRLLVDRRHNRSWTLEWQTGSNRLARDYALIARVRDHVTGQPVILLAGILGEGTEAASEVVSNPAYLRMMLDKAPKNWDEMNLEAVISTQVIDGHAGPPTIVAVECW